mgnify:CR=1 FL=1
MGEGFGSIFRETHLTCLHNYLKQFFWLGQKDWVLYNKRGEDFIRKGWAFIGHSKGFGLANVAVSPLTHIQGYI